MTLPTPPAVSDALREAVGYLALQAPGARKRVDVLLSEIARLTGERDAAREDYRSAEDAFETANHKLATAEAETARLRATLEAQITLRETSEQHSRDFQMMLARLIRRHTKRLDLTEAMAGALSLLARKGTLSLLREARAALSSQEQANV